VEDHTYKRIVQPIVVSSKMCRYRIAGFVWDLGNVEND